jgi:hypothetical protein
MDSAYHSEDRKGRSNLYEFRNWCILVHGYMRSRSGCALQISPQDGGTLVRGNFFEVDLLTLTALEHRSSPGCTYILDPLHVLSEHRHQIPLSINDGHHHRQRDRPSGLSSGHFQCYHIVGNTRRGDNGPRSINHPRDPVGSLPTVQPSLEVAWRHFSFSPFSKCLEPCLNRQVDPFSTPSALVEHASAALSRSAKPSIAVRFCCC